MGLMIGSGNGNVQRIVFKNADGTIAGSMSVRKPGRKKTKRLQYNFKEISAMILQTKTSGSARQVVIRARGKIALLRQRVKGGEYDDQELQNAIIHAEKMERIARKKMRHLQEEERLKKGGPCQGEQEEFQEPDIDPEEVRQEAEQEVCGQRQEAVSRRQRYRMEKLMREMMEETQRELSELSDMDELSEALGGAAADAAAVDMDPEDLKQLKTKHRLEEQREMMEADMLYLKAYFQKLSQEKQESQGAGGSGSGVALEIGGVELPITEPEVPAMPEGGAIDTVV